MKWLTSLLIVFHFTGFSQDASLHGIFNDLLIKHVNQAGFVDYKGFKKDEKELDKYLKILEKNAPSVTASKNEQLAFWINAYNAFTLKLILKNYPVSSIELINNGKPWDLKWIKIANKTYSLNNIEHDIIRKDFKDPRVHFALNCSAKSCPPLLNQAYSAKILDAQLETQTKNFILNKKYNQINSSGVKLSMIFSWYASDFGDVRKFISKYTNIDANAKTRWLEYNWQLNEQ